MDIGVYRICTYEHNRKTKNKSTVCLKRVTISSKLVHTLIWTVKELEKEQSPKSVKGNNKNQRKLID